MKTWLILTGEYPPQPGGGSVYSGEVARGLAAAGEREHVGAPAGSVREVGSAHGGGVVVHGLPGHFGSAARAKTARVLNLLPRDARVLVQYVPHAFGWRAMNVPVVAWLATRRAQPLDVMFHEVAYPLSRRQPLRHNVLGLVHRAMAVALARSAQRVFVSALSWADLLEKLHATRTPAQWLPVPANMDPATDAASELAVREKLSSRAVGGTIIGHFGS